jgi:signal transduction histidine kinase
MAAHAVRIGKHDDLKARLKFDRRDEIGTLAGEVDGMVESLAESRKKVLDSAHRAGKAEIASEVLHNVGNAVNSANCSVEVLEERLDGSKVSGLDRATSLLREQAPRAAEFFGQDPRGPKLIDYLLGLNETLQQERADNQAEVVRLREIVRHIRDAIAAQQTFAGRSDFRQEVELPALVDEILQLNQELLRTSEVQAVVELPSLPELQLNKSKMTQVLVNLVRNAIQSMQGQPSDSRRLTIAARCVEEDGIEIEVRDTGVGFGDDVRPKLFTHGFTTKPEGNGFGLHYCANAIREAGGLITAQSAGPGQGATFRIRLPHVMPAVAASTQSNR